MRSWTSSSCCCCCCCYFSAYPGDRCGIWFRLQHSQHSMRTGRGTGMRTSRTRASNTLLAAAAAACCNPLSCGLWAHTLHLLHTQLPPVGFPVGLGGKGFTPPAPLGDNQRPRVLVLVRMRIRVRHHRLHLQFESQLQLQLQLKLLLYID